MVRKNMRGARGGSGSVFCLGVFIGWTTTAAAILWILFPCSDKRLEGPRVKVRRRDSIRPHIEQHNVVVVDV